MEVVNNNDIFRNFLFEKLRIAKENNDEAKIDSITDELYNSIGSNKYYVSILYFTSYIVNYFTYKKYPDDEETKNAIEFFSNISSIDELMYMMDGELFKDLCYDTFLFSSSDYYYKKRVVMHSKDILKHIIKVAPSFMYDVIKYNIKYTPMIIVDEYRKMLKNGDNEKIALEDAICFGVDYLITLEEDDIDNYREIMYDMINQYYAYNRYLLSKGKKVDEYAPDIISMIEKSTDDLIAFSSSNGELLEPIVRDYLAFMLLNDEEKKEVNEFFKAQVDDIYKIGNAINNPNTTIRKKLYGMFQNLSDFDETKSNTYTLKLSELKNSAFIDDVIKVLYIDNMSIYAFDYYSYPNDDEVEASYLYLKELSSVDEYKALLLEDELVFLEAIANSIYFYNTSLVNKKNIISTLINFKSYDSFLIKTYMFDIIDFNRKYNIINAEELYYKSYVAKRDKKIAIANATNDLGSDLLDLELLDKDNYDELIYDVSKIFYEYNRYLFDNGFEIENESRNILLMMEADLKSFFAKVKKNFIMLETLINSFYEYVSCDELKKQIIFSHFKKIQEEGKSKIFTKKNKNSN